MNRPEKILVGLIIASIIILLIIALTKNLKVSNSPDINMTVTKDNEPINTPCYVIVNGMAEEVPCKG